ncbi:MAG: hypothetical protein IPQ07_22600 [Myxococcales bacterium]|nr:hypothetical protein [Myxococcales bacterium]
MSMTAVATPHRSACNPVDAGAVTPVMRAGLVAVALLAGVAHADDATSLHDGEAPALLRSADEALLHLAPVSLPYTAGLGARNDVDEHTRLRIGTHSWVELEGTRWSNDLDVPARGWGAGIRAAHDFGWFTVSVGAQLNHVDSPAMSRSYYDVGLTISKSKRLSRWMTAWIALTIGRRIWVGERPPLGEQDATQVTLSIGTTFK